MGEERLHRRRRRGRDLRPRELGPAGGDGVETVRGGVEKKAAGDVVKAGGDVDKEGGAVGEAAGGAVPRRKVPGAKHLASARAGPSVWDRLQRRLRRADQPLHRQQRLRQRLVHRWPQRQMRHHHQRCLLEVTTT